MVTNRKLTLKVAPLFVCFFTITGAETFNALLEGRMTLRRRKCVRYTLTGGKKDLFWKNCLFFWTLQQGTSFCLTFTSVKVGTIFFNIYRMITFDLWMFLRGSVLDWPGNIQIVTILSGEKVKNETIWRLSGQQCMKCSSVENEMCWSCFQCDRVTVLSFLVLRVTDGCDSRKWVHAFETVWAGLELVLSHPEKVNISSFLRPGRTSAGHLCRGSSSPLELQLCYVAVIRNFLRKLTDWCSFEL